MRQLFLFIVVFSIFFLSAINALAQASPIPTGRAISIKEILTLTQDFGNYLYTFAGILASITLVWSGVVYLSAGSDSTRVKQAKDILKAGVIGAFIIFGVGTILATVKLIGSGGSIFGGGGGSDTYYGCVGGGACVADPQGFYLNDPTCNGDCTQ